MGRHVLAALLLSLPALGQNTLIVQPGLAGAYQDLATAVAAAQDGDIIRITGPVGLLLAPPRIDKSLRILGQGSVLTGAMQVSIAAGKEFTLQGCGLGSATLFFGWELALQIIGCAGRVTIADGIPAGDVAGQCELRIEDSPQVIVSNCRAGLSLISRLGPTCRVSRSTVAFEHCRFDGRQANTESLQNATEGLLLTDARCSAVDTEVHGGN